MSFLADAATAFVLIIPVELPDKTFVATLMLTTRFRPLAVYTGVISAFLIQCVVAVAAGRLVRLAPHTIVEWIVAALFLVGAILLLREAREHRQIEQDEEAPGPVAHRGGWGAFGASFLVLFAAEWGDLSQLLTAGLVAKGNNPYAVFIGSWLALCLVSGAAVLIGRVLLRHIRLSIIHYVAAGICLVLAIITALAAAGV